MSQVIRGGSTYVYDTDVTVTEFFGSAVNLGTGGACRVDVKESDDFVWMRIAIAFGTSMSIGTSPLTIKASDLPVTIPSYAENMAMPGNFGALSKADDSIQMYAPVLNNIGGFGNCLIFFNEYGAIYTDYLLGSASSVPPVAGDKYNGTIFIPKMTMGS